MNMEEIPTTFDKKEISLYRKNIAIAILLRGGMYRTNEIFLLISDEIYILQHLPNNLEFSLKHSKQHGTSIAIGR